MSSTRLRGKHGTWVPRHLIAMIQKKRIARQPPPRTFGPHSSRNLCPRCQPHHFLDVRAAAKPSQSMLYAVGGIDSCVEAAG
ncbi:hypothetical protein M404DRAFT_811406 [Pisolithus tinctorius Marx 270]|uniref:Uncharacterized protein n=1 Tax=Pisolithus tinctorius Marx 270 TaxID=870435 RepID=A0A0C3NVW5_PISTI|nr:hypothetical protein M404DRAFT_811406 [Pisolithus tinctorius Marx 270]